MGYFHINNLALGLNFEIINSSLSQKDGSDMVKITDSRLSLGPFARYYVTSGKAMPFLEAGLGFGNVTKKDIYNNDETKETHNISNFYAGPGIAVFISDNVALKALIKYNLSKEKYTDGQGSSVSEISLSSGDIFLSVGIHPY